jgi:long-chain fatty acid transport protein
MVESTLVKALSFIAFLWLTPGLCRAGALYIYEMSNASESGYGGAGMAARANDAGTVFSNPAGMTRFDDAEALAGAVGVYIDGGFQTNGLNTASGGSGHVNKRIVPAGSFSYLRPLNDKWTAGVSLHNYFGLAVDWPDDWVGRGSAVNIGLLAPQLQPTIAYEVNDWLSVGAGPALTFGYMTNKLRQEAATPGNWPDGKTRVSDTDFAVQGNFGIMLQPWEHTRIGLRYLTETDLDFEDDPQVSWRDPVGQALGDPKTRLDLRITMPQAVSAGIHHRRNDKLNLLGSVGWDEMSEFGHIQVNIAILDGDFLPGTTVNADFRDTWHFGFGAEYQWKPDLRITAGFSYDTSMSTSRTRPLSIPLGALYRYAIGFKHQRRDHLTVGGGLTWLYEGNLEIDDQPGIGGEVYGRYSNVSLYFLSLYVSWH